MIFFNSKLLKRSKVFVAFALLFISSCKVTWVPEYNAELETAIVATAKQTNKLYLTIADTKEADRTYWNFSTEYQKILSEINSIQLKIQGQKKNKEFLVLIANVKELFMKYSNEHKTEYKTLSSGQIKIYNLQMQAAWKPLYLAQRGIKEN